MPEPHIEDGETYVHGKTPENARRLLAAAEALDLEAYVVRTTQGGYIVPTEVDEWEPVEPVEDAVAAEVKQPASAATPDESWSHADLDAYATDHGVHLNAGINKAAKVAALTEAEKESD